MEKLPTHKILEFHPDTFEFVRKGYGLEKPGQMDAAIDLLDDWVKKQAHFTMREFPREYLERTIILHKGSVERAKQQMDNLFTMKTAVPHFLDKIDPKNDFEDLKDYYADALLPKLTTDHHRIYAGKLLKDGMTRQHLTHSYGFATLIFEHIIANDYCTGFVAIMDYRSVNILDFVKQINIMEMHQLLQCVTNGYQMRMKGIHMLTNSRAIELMVRIFKQAFSKKIGDRIKVHTSLESLHEGLPKDILPQEFGGHLKSLVDFNKDWIDLLSEKENIEYFKQIKEAKVNENLRSGSRTAKDDIVGVSGSFRTLCVD